MGNVVILDTCLQVLKDDTTLADNKVSENGFMVIMVTKVMLVIRRADAIDPKSQPRLVKLSCCAA